MFLSGEFQHHADINEAAPVLRACDDAAAAARHMAASRVHARQPLRNPQLMVPLAAALVAVVCVVLRLELPEAVIVANGIVASAHIPLALLALGASIKMAPVAQWHAGPVRTVLAIRLATGAVVGGLLAVITPPFVPFAMRSAAIMICLLAPVSPQVRSHLLACRGSSACMSGFTALVYNMLHCSTCADPVNLTCSDHDSSA